MHPQQLLKIDIFGGQRKHHPDSSAISCNSDDTQREDPNARPDNSPTDNDVLSTSSLEYTARTVKARTVALYRQFFGPHRYVTQHCDIRATQVDEDLEAFEPDLKVWYLIFQRLDSSSLCAISIVCKRLSGLAINFLYRNITLAPRTVEECDYEDLALVLRKLNTIESLRLISYFTKSFTISPGWYLLARQHSDSDCEVLASYDTREILLGELSILIGSIVKNIRHRGLESFVLASPIPLSAYVFSNLSHNSLVLKDLRLNIHPKAVLPGLNSIRDPFLTPYRHGHKPFLELRPVNLLTLNLYHASSVPDTLWWSMLHNLLAACAPTLRHLHLEFPHIDRSRDQSNNGYKPGVPPLNPLPTLSQSRFLSSHQNAGDKNLTLWSLNLAGMHLDSDFIHWCFPSLPSHTNRSSSTTGYEYHKSREITLKACSINKYKPPRGYDCGPTHIITDSFTTLRLFITRSSLSHLHHLELQYPLAANARIRNKDQWLIDGILMSVPELKVLKLSEGITLNDRALRKLLNMESKLMTLEIEVLPKQWRQFIGLLRQTENLNRVVVLGKGLQGTIPVKGGNGVRMRGLADEAEEIAAAVEKNRGLKIVGRNDFAWEVLETDKGEVRIKRVKDGGKSFGVYCSWGL